MNEITPEIALQNCISVSELACKGGLLTLTDAVNIKASIDVLANLIPKAEESKK